ncbi:RagB/SusD family nutrient uptake outer membrane protein [Chitinophaga pinensis]|uniref:RagB/SusD family nutrient uptake outer membrane protein n=1 Tax=Chitinophaga pinensis TaxID=79329 RepID=A0A5C6LLG4_9BACT|nr:RagB/SusD family nutrient uptake outer membrane protein [Chitinophaga pinensis]TWV94298.1 RagB/SusD family nutrient uptake outer membrane protein [Chitinophaga pinensis]
MLRLADIPDKGRSPSADKRWQWGKSRPVCHQIPRGLPAIVTTDPEELMQVIQHERRIELFSEWGHRWMDLKRTHHVDDVMKKAAIAKGTDWAIYAQWYPIPRSEIILNKHLSQNEGYHD